MIAVSRRAIDGTASATSRLASRLRVGEDKDSARLDERALDRPHLGDTAGTRHPYVVLHLHGFEYRHRLPIGHRIARRDQHLDDPPGHRGGNNLLTAACGGTCAVAPGPALSAGERHRHRNPIHVHAHTMTAGVERDVVASARPRRTGRLRANQQRPAPGKPPRVHATGAPVETDDPFMSVSTNVHPVTGAADLNVHVSASAPRGAPDASSPPSRLRRYGGTSPDEAAEPRRRTRRRALPPTATPRSRQSPRPLLVTRWPRRTARRRAAARHRPETTCARSTEEMPPAEAASGRTGHWCARRGRDTRPGRAASWRLPGGDRPPTQSAWTATGHRTPAPRRRRPPLRHRVRRARREPSARRFGRATG